MDAINFQLTKIQNFKRERLDQRVAKWSAGAYFIQPLMYGSTCDIVGMDEPTTVSPLFQVSSVQLLSHV